MAIIDVQSEWFSIGLVCADGEDDSRRSHRHDMLKSYYGMEGEGEGAAEGAGGREDINGPGFEAEAYLARLLRERTLTDLMREEEQMVHHIRSLDSDMQTLVYENYNKFISATDTIRKVRGWGAGTCRRWCMRITTSSSAPRT